MPFSLWIIIKKENYKHTTAQHANRSANLLSTPSLAAVMNSQTFKETVYSFPQNLFRFSTVYENIYQGGTEEPAVGLFYQLKRAYHWLNKDMGEF